MSRGSILFVAVCATVLVFAVADRSLKCYDCFGFDTSFSEHDFNNTKKCLTDSFSTSVKTASKSVPDDGSVVVFCYSIVLFANGMNSDYPYTLRGVETNQSQVAASAQKLQDQRGSQMPPGSVDIFVCNTELCNSGSTRITAIGVVVMLLPLALQRLFL